MGVELLNADIRADGQTDITELILAFRNFVNAPNAGVYFFGLSCCVMFLAVIARAE